MRVVKCLYGFLCVLSVLLGLFPSLFLNVKPFLMHDQTGMALVQFVLTLVTAAIPLIIFRLHWLEAFIAGLLLMGLLRVSVANGIESVTLTRGEISSGRQEALDVKGDWTARIEKWVEERDVLKQRFIPLKGEKEYVPTGEEVVATSREGRDAACKFTSVSEACKTAQSKLEQVTQNYELTKRVDQLERDIREAQNTLRQVGHTPPDYLGQAKAALAGAWFDPLQDREMWQAYIAEGVAAFAPKFLVFLISFLFAASLGEKWWQESTSSSPPIESTPVESTPAFKHTALSPPLVPPRKPANTPKRLAYVDGVTAWVAIVTPKPGARGDRYTPGRVYSHYVEFCKAEGYTPAPLQMFGQVLKVDCGLIPAARTGGQSHYEWTISKPAKLALVKV